jgi:hypothetical protein
MVVDAKAILRSDSSNDLRIDEMSWDQLRTQVDKHLDLEELRTLCFDLGVDYDSLRGEGKSARIRELIALLRRNNRLPQLIAALNAIRPNVQWGTIQLDDVSPSSSPKHNIGRWLASGGLVILIALIGALFASGSTPIAFLPPHTQSPTTEPTTASTVALSTSTAQLPTDTLSPTDLPSTIAPTTEVTTAVPPTNTLEPAVTSVPVGGELFAFSTPGTLDNWFLSGDWSTLDGAILSDGTVDEALPWREFRWIEIPYDLSGTQDYAIEAEIQAGSFGNLANYPCISPAFGFVVRARGDEGYQAGVTMPIRQGCGTGGTAYVGAFWANGGWQGLGDVPFQAGTSAHTYRVEVKGTTITYFIDDQQALQVSDNRYPPPGQVGLYFDAIQVTIKYLRIIKL